EFGDVPHAVDVRTFVTMTGLDPEAEQRGAGLQTGLDRGRGVGAVVPVDVAPVGEVVGLAEADQPTGQVVVERPGAVQHGDVDHVFTRLLALTDHPVVHGDELGHAVVQPVGGAHADFFPDGHEQVRANREVGLVLDQCAYGGQAGG